MTRAGAISRTTLHIPFNFIRSPGEPRRKYIGARIRGSFINIVAVISLSCLVRLRPPDIQMSAGISGLTRFSASKYYLPPRRRRSVVHRRFAQEERNTRRALAPRGLELSPARISLFQRGLTIQ